MSTLQIVLTIVGLVVAVSSVVVPLALGVYQLKKYFDWQKGMLSVRLGIDWSEKTLIHRQIIEKHYGSYLVNVDPIIVPGTKKFVNAIEGEELYALKIAVISLMNYFEDIAVLYLSGMADRQILDETLRQPMTRYYDKIKPLAGCIDKVAGYPSWKPLDDLMKLWKEENDAKKGRLSDRKFP